MFVDRGELQEVKNIACPWPTCQYVWCKACQQPIEVDGPEHSCDGSNELQHLMQQKGWKPCPGEHPIFRVGVEEFLNVTICRLSDTRSEI